MDSVWVATPGKEPASVSQAARCGIFRKGVWHLQEGGVASSGRGSLAVVTDGWGVIH